VNPLLIGLGGHAPLAIIHKDARAQKTRRVIKRGVF
jgi:hypothetical protein